MTKVLFVCLGNICRSPTAEAVFRGLAEQEGLGEVLLIDSAGTSGYHIGEAPDGRAAAVARQRGYDMSAIRGRQVALDDYERFDYILAMDRANLSDLQRTCPEVHQKKIALFLSFSEQFTEDEVPDPYYGGPEGFDRVFDMVEDASKGLLSTIKSPAFMLSIQENISLQALNTFRIPAKARWFCEVRSEQDLQELVARLAEFPPYMVLGGGSNVLFGGDYHGLIILNRIGGSRLENVGQHFVYHLGSGENWHAAVRHSVMDDYYGLENLSLIPGTVGAAPIQNIGAYGVELKDAFIGLKAMDMHTGQWAEFSLADCRFDYRDSLFKQQGRDRYCIVSVSLRLQREGALRTGYGEIAAEIDRRGWHETSMSPRQMSDVIIAIRQRKLPDPAELPNAGSFFKNPVVSAQDYAVLHSRFPDIASYPAADGRVKLACGWLIDRLGWKGRSLNGAKVHDQQALVLINDGGGAAAIKALANRIQAEVLDTYGVVLEPEPVWVE